MLGKQTLWEAPAKKKCSYIPNGEGKRWRRTPTDCACELRSVNSAAPAALAEKQIVALRRWTTFCNTNMGLARIKAGPTCLYIYSICIFAILSLAVTSAPDIIHWDMVSNHMRFGGQLVVQKLPAKRIYHYHKTLQNTSASSVRSCNSSRQSWHLMSCNKKLNRRSIEPLTCGPAVDSLQNSSKPNGAFAWLEPQMISNFCQIISGIAFHQISSDVEFRGQWFQVHQSMW